MVEVSTQFAKPFARAAKGHKFVEITEVNMEVNVHHQGELGHWFHRCSVAKSGGVGRP